MGVSLEQPNSFLKGGKAAMKKVFSFIVFVLMVFLILSFLSDVGFAKMPKKAWLWMLPGRPPRAYLSNEVYLHSSYEYPGVNVSSPIVKLIARTDEHIDLIAKTTTTWLGDGGISVTTHTLLNVTSTFAETVHTQFGAAPRNLIATFDGGAMQSTGTCLVTGLDARGNEITETLVVWDFVNADNYGVKAFSKITSSVWTLTVSTIGSDTSLFCQLGTGDVIGLRGDIGLTTHFYKGTVDVVDETGSFTVNAIYDTWTHSDVPDASDDYILYYKCDSETNPR